MTSNASLPLGGMTGLFPRFRLLKNSSQNGWITTSAPIFAPHSLDSAVTTGIGPGHQKTDSLVQPDPRSSVRDRLALQELEPLLALGDDQGWVKGGRGKRLWVQPCNDRHCGAASVTRPGLATWSAVEGTAVMRGCGRVRLFMTLAVPDLWSDVKSSRICKVGCLAWVRPGHERQCRSSNWTLRNLCLSSAAICRECSREGTSLASHRTHPENPSWTPARIWMGPKKPNDHQC
jgi:hypothetical protein